jgi:ADP-heptose:LPS heptosyltransferase
MKTLPANIGIFRALQLGDLLCIIPTMRALRTAYPFAHITLIGLPWQKGFVERFQQYFDAFVEFPGWPGLPEQPVDIKKIVPFLLSMQQQEFDLVLQMQGNGESTNAMCMLFGAKKVCGLRKPDEYCPDEKLFPISGDEEHEVLRFLKLIDALDLPFQGHELEFPFLDGEQEKLKKRLKKQGLLTRPYICIHPGSRDPKRRWATQRFAAVADMLARQGFDIVLTGSEEEKDLLREVGTLMTQKAVNAVDEFGNLPLGELAALLNYSVGLLSNDTGVSHIAAALKLPSVIVFSEYSKPNRWAPLDTARHTIVLPGQSQNCENVFNEVMNSISLGTHAVIE